MPKEKLTLDLLVRPRALNKAAKPYAWGWGRSRYTQLFGAKTGLRTRGLKRVKYGESQLETLARDSEWGGNNFERAADGAAHKRGHHFLGAQYYIVTPSTPGGYTLVDRVAPFNQMVYLDGIQHRMRPDSAAKDILQDTDLKYQGYRPIRISDTDFMNDPIGVIDTRIDWIGEASFYSYRVAVKRVPLPAPPIEEPDDLSRKIRARTGGKES